MIEYTGKPDSEVQELFEFAVSKGFTLRDDSPLVGYYVENFLETWSVSHPQFYDPLFLERPIILECDHYHSVLNDGNWLGRNGEATIQGKGVSGAEVLRGAVATMHATYIGFHGYMEKWLKENPDLTKELANLCGYWYFPVEVTLPDRIPRGETARIDIGWMNRGVAPAYLTFNLRIRLQNMESGYVFEHLVADSGNRSWMPGELKTEVYSLQTPPDLVPGSYRLKIKLSDPTTAEDVDIGLKESLRDKDGYYLISEVVL